MTSGMTTEDSVVIPEILIFGSLWVSVLVWPASLLESGGRCLALGFPGLCEAGPVESDE